MALVCGFCLLSGWERQNKKQPTPTWMKIKDVCVLSLQSISLEIGFSHRTNCKNTCHYPFNKFTVSSNEEFNKSRILGILITAKLNVCICLVQTMLSLLIFYLFGFSLTLCIFCTEPNALIVILEHASGLFLNDSMQNLLFGRQKKIFRQIIKTMMVKHEMRRKYLCEKVNLRVFFPDFDSPNFIYCHFPMRTNEQSYNRYTQRICLCDLLLLRMFDSKALLFFSSFLVKSLHSLLYSISFFLLSP